MISAAYKFPKGFRWGISPVRSSASINLTADRNYSNILYRMQERRFSSLLLRLSWKSMLPERDALNTAALGQYRAFLSRMRDLNIEPVLFFDNTDRPEWFEKDGGWKAVDAENLYFNFAAKVIDETAPFVTRWVTLCHEPKPGLFAKDKLTDTYTEIAARLRTAAPKAVCCAAVKVPQNGKFSPFYRNTLEAFLKNTEPDNLCLIPDRIDNYDVIREFGSLGLPLFILSDRLNEVPETKKSEALSDSVYHLWLAYQQGIDIRGYMAELDVFETDSRANKLYSRIGTANAFEISTEDELLPEKWLRFLKE